MENIEKITGLKIISFPADTDDEEAVEIDVCLRGFSIVPLGHLPSKVNIYILFFVCLLIYVHLLVLLIYLWELWWS